MPRSLRILVPLFLGAAAIVLPSSIGLCLPYSRTQRVAADQELLLLSFGLHYDPDRTRQVCHRVLRTREGNHHDAFLMLQCCGDLSSVPYLVRALRWHPAEPNGSMICTTAHGIKALKAITHEDFGLDLNAWEAWSEKDNRNITDRNVYAALNSKETSAHPGFETKLFSPRQAAIRALLSASAGRF